ncbi:hypothetical protein NST12_16700 [Bacillus sp. FSL W8-1127]|uniref:hypothetical protein n=1 Tax=Bacillus sp. FSL W8-1127 TaxID=2954710 RepID=UPI0030F92FEB
MKQALYKVATLKEIEEELNLPETTVRRDISRNRFWSHELRKSGSTWLIMKREAYRVYKKEYENVKVKCDLRAINEYVYSILNDDDELYELASDLFKEQDIKQLCKLVSESYADAINDAGLYEDGKVVEYICVEQYLFLLNEEEKSASNFKRN